MASVLMPLKMLRFPNLRAMMQEGSWSLAGQNCPALFKCCKLGFHGDGCWT
jgi:hypothetical protein